MKKMRMKGKTREMKMKRMRRKKKRRKRKKKRLWEGKGRRQATSKRKRRARAENSPRNATRPEARKVNSSEQRRTIMFFSLGEKGRADDVSWNCILSLDV